MCPRLVDAVLDTAGPLAYKRLNGRLFVSVTQFVRTNVVVSTWTSNVQVKKVVMAVSSANYIPLMHYGGDVHPSTRTTEIRPLQSCFIPLAMLRPVWLKEVGFLAIDGGFSHNHPRINENTVLVSPARTP